MPDLLAALAPQRRREILQAVWEEELAAGEIHRRVGSVTFGAVSQHLRALAEAGAVQVRTEGRNRLYRADKERLGPLAEWLEAHWARSLSRLKRLAEDEEERA